MVKSEFINEVRCVKKFKIAIDAGHGSNTAGKRHPDGYREHYSNTYMAFYLDQILTKNGIETLNVGWDDENVTDDTDVALAARQAQVKAFGADISVSMHANVSGNGTSYNSANGIETLYHSADSKAGDSAKLAKLVQAELIKGTKQTNRGVKRMSLAMCNCTAMGTKASILIETAFMTNKYESDLLKSDEFCRECARETAQGIFNYFGINGNVNVSLTSAISGTTENVETATPNTSTSTSNITSSTVSTSIKTGASFKLANVYFYGSSTSKSGVKKTGTFYVWSNTVINGRIRMTNAKSRVGAAGQITGWVNESVLKSLVKPTTSTTASVKGIKISNGRYYYNNVDYTQVFNSTFYSNTYVDLKKAFGNNVTKLFNHFIQNGMKEGRKACSNFDVNVYKNRYEDLRKAFGNNLPEYYRHYIQFGIKEGRKGI